LKEYSAIEVSLILASGHRTSFWTVGVACFIGLVIAVSAEAQYTAETLVMSELGGEGSNDVSSALLSFGLLESRGLESLSGQAIPAIATSREVRLSVVRDTLEAPFLGGRGTLATALADRMEWSYRLRQYFSSGRQERAFGGSIVELRKSLFPEAANLAPPPSASEEYAMDWLLKAMSVEPNLETGLLTLSVTSPGARLSARIAAAVLRETRRRVQEVFTRKERRNLARINAQLAVAADSLRRADFVLARFEDRNRGRTSAFVNTERSRLQRAVLFASQLRADLEFQRADGELALQRSEPVITVIQEAVPPFRQSAPKRKRIVFVWLVLGVVTGAALTLALDASHDPHYAELITKFRGLWRPSSGGRAADS
jgi:uncharacterized protein involved in exopolysaccharide biosynthesis